MAQQVAEQQQQQMALQMQQQMQQHMALQQQYMAQHMQACMLAVHSGQPMPSMPPMPPIMFLQTPAPAPATPANQLAASNNLEASSGMSPTFPPQQLFPPLLGGARPPFEPPPSQ